MKPPKPRTRKRVNALSAGATKATAMDRHISVGAGSRSTGWTITPWPTCLSATWRMGFAYSSSVCQNTSLQVTRDALLADDDLLCELIAATEQEDGVEVIENSKGLGNEDSDDEEDDEDGGDDDD